jgi:hypothetical protein
MRRVLETRKDAPSALYRDGVGVIGFRYGAHYPATKKRKRSYGLAHVIGSAKEDFGKYPGAPEPEEVLRRIPETILYGKLSGSHKGRLKIENKGILVLLTRHGKNAQAPHWLFHAYKIKPAQK